VSPECQTTLAVDIIARRVLDSAIDWERVEEAWEDWGEIGANDWRAVVARAKAIAERFAPQTEKIPAAYEYLKARADSA
jgi:hypothetical protein